MVPRRERDRPVAKRRIVTTRPADELLEVLVDAGHSRPAPIPVAIETTRALLVLRR
jgi:hypothetical protein